MDGWPLGEGEGLALAVNAMAYYDASLDEVPTVSGLRAAGPVIFLDQVIIGAQSAPEIFLLLAGTVVLTLCPMVFQSLEDLPLHSTWISDVDKVELPDRRCCLNDNSAIVENRATAPSML